MKKLALITIFISQFFIGLVCYADQAYHFNAFIEKAKIIGEKIVDGAYETWDDLKEVYDEVSTELTDKAKENYEKVSAKIDVKKYFVDQIGQAQISFFQIVRKVNNNFNDLSPKAVAWLKEHGQKNRLLNPVKINEFLGLIDSKTQEKIALEMIKKIHNADAFNELMKIDDESKEVRFEFLFALYAYPFLDHYKDSLSDVYVGLAYAKLLLRNELFSF